MRAGYNFKVAFRNLSAHRFYSLLNVLGLTLGMATSIMLLIWVHYQFSFDRFHEHSASIYRINTTLAGNDGPMSFDKAPSGLPVLTRGISGIRKAVRMRSWNDQLISTPDRKNMIDGNYIAYTDPEFFSVFDFTLLEGDKATCLSDINGAVLTSEVARQLFGSVHVVGRQIRYFGDTYRISGVLAPFAENSTLQYQAFFPMDAFARRLLREGSIEDPNFLQQDIGRIAFDDYLLLDPKANPASVAMGISKNFAAQAEEPVTFSLQPLEQLHLVTAEGNLADLRMVQMLLAVALLVLVVAAINYMNLTTARSLTRLKEVAVRKINGASDRQLLLLFVTEALLLFLVAAALAICVVYLMVPAVSQFTGAALEIVTTDATTIGIIGAVLLGTFALAAIFPAYLLSRLGVTTSLKRNLREGRYGRLRKALVVLQFASTFILLMGATIIHRQMHFVEHKDLGFDRSYVFVVPMTNNMVDRAGAMRAQLLLSPSIQAVGTADVFDLFSVANVTGNVRWPGKADNDNTLFTELSGDRDFISTMNFVFTAGSNFTGTASDSNKVIINETAARRMHLQPPYAGQQIRYHNRLREIIGVVRDFNYAPLTESIGPVIMDSGGFKNILYVRTSAAQVSEALAVTGQFYKTYSGDVPFSYTFMDKNFAQKYESEQKTSQLLKAFSFVALAISCLGLFGLATFTAEIRKKEIGIRKVLGASVGALVRLMTTQFLKLVLVAVVLGSPVAYYLTARWQSHFVYKVPVGWLPFVAGALLIVIVTVLTILFIALKSARANPVSRLQSE